MSLSPPGFGSTNPVETYINSIPDLNIDQTGTNQGVTINNNNNSLSPLAYYSNPFDQQQQQHLVNSLTQYDPFHMGFQDTNNIINNNINTNDDNNNNNINNEQNKPNIPKPSKATFDSIIPPIDQVLHHINMANNINMSPNNPNNLYFQQQNKIHKNNKNNNNNNNNNNLHTEQINVATMPPMLPLPSIHVENESDPAKMLTALDLEHRTLNHLQLLYSSEIARLEHEAAMIIELITQQQTGDNNFDLNNQDIVSRLNLTNVIGHGLPQCSGKVYYEMYGKSLAQNDIHASNLLEQQYQQQQKQQQQPPLSNEPDAITKSDQRRQKEHSQYGLYKNFQPPQIRPYIPHIEMHDGEINKHFYQAHFEDQLGGDNDHDPNNDTTHTNNAAVDHNKKSRNNNNNNNNNNKNNPDDNDQLPSLFTQLSDTNNAQSSQELEFDD